MKLFSKEKKTFGLDIGSSSIKLAELERKGGKLCLMNLARFELEGDFVSNNVVTKADELSEHIITVLEANSIENRDAVLAIPGPSVFVKKIKMPLLPDDELRDNIELEAASIIPHSISQVQLDFHVIGPSGKNSLEVLLVAVKNEVLESFVDTVAMAGFETAVADVDYFALQNAFELSEPENIDETSALISIGSRGSIVNICSKGNSLFAGDITVGGKQFTEAIERANGCSFSEAEQLKRSFTQDESVLGEEARAALFTEVEKAAEELARQLNFFWEAASDGSAVRRVYLTGGGSLMPRLDEELSERLGIEVVRLDPFRNLELEDSLDGKFVEDLKPFASLAIGLAMREAGDREVHDFA